MTDEAQADFPQAWRPEAGDAIKGTVVSVTLSPDFGYGPYPIVTLKTDGGERAVHAMHQILRTELARRRPKRDDEIEITYLGKRSPRSGSGNPFHVYKVEGGNEPEFNWESELPDEERQARATQTAEPPITAAPTPSQQPQAAPAPAGQQFGEVPF